MEDPADLSHLADIAVPAPIAWWPPAPGWWIVATFLLVALVLLLAVARRRWHDNAYRRQALAELNALEPVDNASSVAALSAVLKRTALVAYPREQVASLTGQEWPAFLDRTGGEGRFSATAGFATAAYGGSVTDGALLQAAARRWVKRHRMEG